jgi:predicted nuclease with TOPRIM domain
MIQHLKRRIQSLQVEYEAGQKLLAEYEAKQRNLRETLLRISGAIQVLEEVLAEADSDANGEVSQPKDSPAELQPLGELAASGEGT